MNLIVANIQVKQDETGRYLLNDLHRASGQNPKNKPSEWLRNKQTKELIEEIQIAGIPAIETKQKIGTFVCKELVYSYAMWISPSFHLKVIRAYDQLQQQPGAIPPASLDFNEYEEEIEHLKVQVAALKDELLDLYRDKSPMRKVVEKVVHRVPVAAIELMAEYGVPREKIAAVSGKSRSCIRVHIHNARKHTKEQLN